MCYNSKLMEIMLPKKMLPDRKVFEDIGFKFEDTGDSVLFKTTLLEGWTLHESESYYFKNLTDEKNRIRVIVFYKDSCYSRKTGEMRLLQYYNPTYTYLNPNNKWNSPLKILIQDPYGKEIFVAGVCKNILCDKEYEKLMTEIRKYLDINFPKWGDPTKYWD